MHQLKNVVTGTDFSDASRNAVREAARIAAWQDATLHVVHVLPESAVAELQALGLSREAALARGHDSLSAFMREVADDIPKVEFHVAVGNPFRELARVVQATAADLLVVGCYGRGDDPHHVGTVASHCARRIPVPVLLVRPTQVKPFRHIVACVDFSPTSTRAAEEAARIAHQDGSTLHLLHVHYPPWLYPSSMLYGLPDVTSESFRRGYLGRIDQQMDVLGKAVAGVAPDVEIRKTMVEDRVVGQALVDHLKEVDADLAVVGTHGHTGLELLLVGSAAERVIAKSPCSVLVIKPEGFRFSIV